MPTFVNAGWDRLMALRLFCHCDYARIYLGGIVFTPVAFLHYLLFGCRRGNLPNPFFDPAYFEQRSGTRSLLRYILLSRYWTLATSPLFDSAFYRKVSKLPNGHNPLADFWLRGFDKRYSPAPGFDIHFFRDVVCRDQWNDRRQAFVLFAAQDYAPPTDAAAYLARREAFVAKQTYRRLPINAVKPRRNLVFVQAGAGFEAPYINSPRDFDVLLNYYEEPKDPLPSVEHAIVQTGTKTTAIRRILAIDPDILLRYDSVLFLDDDIEIDGDAIKKSFAVFTAEGLDLAQPSLTSDSACFFDCLKQPSAGPRTRRMNAVEIMMPIISRRALKHAGWVFEEGVSGWAVDLLLSATVRQAFGDTIGLIGEVAAIHRKGVDTVGGRFYKFLLSSGIDANTEAGYIIHTFDLGPEQATITYLPFDAAASSEHVEP